MILCLGSQQERRGSAPSPKPEQSDHIITIKAYSNLNGISRVGGAITVSDKLLAVWPSGDGDGMHLYSA